MPKNLEHIQSLARAHTEAAIKTLTEIMADPKAPASTRRAAAAVLRNHGFPGGDAAGDRRAARAAKIKDLAWHEFKHGQFHVKPTD
jgi:hypothetical protein